MPVKNRGFEVMYCYHYNINMIPFSSACTGSFTNLLKQLETFISSYILQMFVNDHACHHLALGDLSFIRVGANGGRVIKFYVAKKGRVTKNLSWVLGRAIPCLANIAVHLK